MKPKIFSSNKQPKSKGGAYENLDFVADFGDNEFVANFSDVDWVNFSHWDHDGEDNKMDDKVDDKLTVASGSGSPTSVLQNDNTFNSPFPIQDKLHLDLPCNKNKSNSTSKNKEIGSSWTRDHPFLSSLTLHQSLSIIFAAYWDKADLYTDVLSLKDSNPTSKQLKLAFFRAGRAVLSTPIDCADDLTTLSVGMKAGSEGMKSNNVSRIQSGVPVSRKAKLRFQAITIAYELLDNSVKRRKYDEWRLLNSPVTPQMDPSFSKAITEEVANDDLVNIISDTKNKVQKRSDKFEDNKLDGPTILRTPKYGGRDKVTAWKGCTRKITWNEEVEEIVIVDEEEEEDDIYSTSSQGRPIPDSDSNKRSSDDAIEKRSENVEAFDPFGPNNSWLDEDDSSLSKDKPFMKTTTNFDNERWGDECKGSDANNQVTTSEPARSENLDDSLATILDTDEQGETDTKIYKGGSLLDSELDTSDASWTDNDRIQTDTVAQLSSSNHKQTIHLSEEVKGKDSKLQPLEPQTLVGDDSTIPDENIKSHTFEIPQDGSYFEPRILQNEPNDEKIDTYGVMDDAKDCDALPLCSSAPISASPIQQHEENKLYLERENTSIFQASATTPQTLSKNKDENTESPNRDCNTDFRSSANDCDVFTKLSLAVTIEGSTPEEEKKRVVNENKPPSIKPDTESAFLADTPALSQGTVSTSETKCHEGNMKEKINVSDVGYSTPTMPPKMELSFDGSSISSFKKKKSLNVEDAHDTRHEPTGDCAAFASLRPIELSFDESLSVFKKQNEESINHGKYDCGALPDLSSTIIGPKLQFLYSGGENKEQKINVETDTDHQPNDCGIAPLEMGLEFKDSLSNYIKSVGEEMKQFKESLGKRLNEFDLNMKQKDEYPFFLQSTELDALVKILESEIVKKK